jgi:hypothetical protein
VAELVAAALLLIPGMAAYGAILTLGVITGAIASHVTVLGIEVQGDGGLLFGLAVAVFVASAIVLVVRWREVTLLRTLAPGSLA